MRVDFQPSGIYLPDCELWLDSLQPVQTNWISHAHSDHARGGHQTIYSSKETFRFLQVRDETLQNDLNCSFVEMDGDWMPLANGHRMRSVLCAHIVGARQLLVESPDGSRICYTGDIKLRDSLLGSSTEVPQCDQLIIESTFGLPIFHFLDATEAADRILDFAHRCLKRGEIPVFLGYGLGRGQEIVHVLGNAGVPVAVHGAIAKLIPIHQEFGYSFPNWEPYNPKSVNGKALVVVPGFRDVLKNTDLPVRVAYVSGWALLDHSRSRTGAEELIPYSDHGDFAELVEIVDRSGAKRVDVVHGYTEAFSQILRQRGIDARPAHIGPHAEIGKETLHG